MSTPAPAGRGAPAPAGRGAPAPAGARQRGREAPPLGTHAKFPSKAPQSHEEKAKERRTSAVARRYELQDMARAILPRERVALCGRLIIPTKSTVKVLLDTESESAHFGQLVTCGSLWHCPICASKITERRRIEVAAALAAWRDRAGLVCMVTFTLSHHERENLQTVLERLKNAREHMLSGRASVAFRAEHGVIGSIRALEITHGVNGWHPHLHVLMFLSPEINRSTADSDYFARSIKASWAAAVDAQSGHASWAHGCDVQFCEPDDSDDSEEISDYFLKISNIWDESHELTKNNLKVGKQAGRSPMQLLSNAANGDEAAARLWLQYACVMKGERLLYWSRGLRNLLGLNAEKTDEEVAEEEVAESVLVVEIGKAAWQVVLGNAARADVLAAAASGGYEAVIALLSSLGVPDEHIPLWPEYRPPIAE